jgi:hypothetical protein
MSRLCWRPEMAGAPQPVCDAKSCCELFPKAEFGKNFKAPAAPATLFFLGIESLFECQDIFREFEFDPVASASIAQVLDAHTSMHLSSVDRKPRGDNKGRQQRMEIATHKITKRDKLSPPYSILSPKSQ